MVAISGGYSSGSSGIKVFSNHAATTANSFGWIVGFDNYFGNTPSPVDVYAYCAPNVTFIESVASDASRARPDPSP